jgi:hypothetical protein
MNFEEYCKQPKKVLVASVELTERDCVSVVREKTKNCLIVEFECDDELHTYRTRDNELDGALYTMFPNGDLKNMSMFRFVKDAENKNKSSKKD